MRPGWPPWRPRSGREHRGHGVGSKIESNRGSRAYGRTLAAILAEQRDLLEGDLFLNLATADVARVPHIAIGVGFKVSSKPLRVTVLVVREQALGFLDALATTRRIALELGRAPAHESLQIKGDDCVIDAAGAAERRLASDYRGKLLRQFGVLGLGSEMADAYLGPPSSELVALRFTPQAIFQQMPGPHAGQPLV